MGDCVQEQVIIRCLGTVEDAGRDYLEEWFIKVTGMDAIRDYGMR